MGGCIFREVCGLKAICQSHIAAMAVSEHRQCFIAKLVFAVLLFYEVGQWTFLGEEAEVVRVGCIPTVSMGFLILQADEVLQPGAITY